jgi:ketosteroid isomerase-like protein
MSQAPSRRRARLFPTAEECEAAFYGAFERGDIKAMMAVWAESDEISCVHPSGARITGFDAVRESWVQIFAGAPQLRVKTLDVRRFEGQGIEVRHVIEEISPRGQPGTSGTAYATNVYELTEGGWRMVLHHASASAAPAAPEERPAPTHTLH